MSSTQILFQNIDNYSQQFEDRLIKQANALWLEYNYLVKSDLDSAEVAHNLVYDRMLCTQNCTLINYINKKIAGKLEKKCKKRLSDSINNYKSCYKKISCKEAEESCIGDIGITQF